jgi:hypothetical protein
MKTTRIDEFLAKLAKIKCSVTLQQLTDLYSQKNPAQMEKKLKSISRFNKQLNRIEKLCNEEMAYLLRNLKPTTVSSTITQYRRALKSFDADHAAIFYFKMPKDFYASIKSDYVEKRTTESRNKIGFKRSQIEPYVEKLIWLCQQDSYSLVALGICGLTGRRPSEVLTTAIFRPAIECKYCDNSLIFSGQLKTKDCESARDNYEIPVLCDDEKIVIDALAKLRTLKDFSSLEIPPEKRLSQVVNSITAKTLNESAKRHLSGFLGNEVKPYNLRALYVTIMADRYFVNSDTVSEFFSELLGHSKDDKDSQLSYQDFYLEN